jgi:hypothetical protein
MFWQLTACKLLPLSPNHSTGLLELTLANVPKAETAKNLAGAGVRVTAAVGLAAGVGESVGFPIAVGVCVGTVLVAGVGVRVGAAVGGFGVAVSAASSAAW